MEWLMDREDRNPDFRDWRNALHYVLTTLYGWEPTKVQYEMMAVLQAWICSGKPAHKIMIQAQRGEGKSLIASIAMVMTLYWWPEKKLFVPSASIIRARNFVRYCKDIITELPEFQCLLPPEGGRDYRWSTDQFDVMECGLSHNPSMKAVGIGGHMAGSHADVVLGDDIEVPNNSSTPAARAALEEKMRELTAIQNDGGRQGLLGTFQTEDSVYNGLAAKGYKIYCWPGRYPGTDEYPLHHYEGRLAPSLHRELLDDPTLAGTPTDPERFDEEELTDRELEGKAWFALQYMLDPQLSDAARQPLKLSDAIVMAFDREALPGVCVWGNAEKVPVDHSGKTGDDLYYPAMAGDYGPPGATAFWIDPSGEGLDETAWAWAGLRNGRLFLEWGSFETNDTDRMADLIREYGPQRIGVEKQFGGSVLASVLTGMTGKEVLSLPAVGQKELRILATLEPLFRKHRIVLSEESLKRDQVEALARRTNSEEKWPQYAFTHQAPRITRDRNSLGHDDRLDAVAGAVAMLAEFVTVTPEDHTSRRLDRLTKRSQRRGVTVRLGNHTGPERKYKSRHLNELKRK